MGKLTEEQARIQDLEMRSQSIDFYKNEEKLVLPLEDDWIEQIRKKNKGKKKK